MYPRGVIAGMKPIANDAVLRDWQVNVSAHPIPSSPFSSSGAATPPTAPTLLQSATRGATLPRAEINSIELPRIIRVTYTCLLYVFDVSPSYVYRSTRASTHTSRRYNYMYCQLSEDLIVFFELIVVEGIQLWVD